MSIPTNNLSCGKGEDFNPTFVLGVKIKTVSVSTDGVNATVETETPHGFANGDIVYILNVVGSTPAVDNHTDGYQVTVVDDTHFTIPVNVTVAGQFGTCNNIVGDITGQTIQGFTKTADTAASPTLTVNGEVVGSPSHTFKLPYTSTDTQALVVGTSYLHEARRTDDGLNTIYSQGSQVVATERQFQTP